jgi:hypothetical protein
MKITEENLHLTSEQFQGLLQGKKLVFDVMDSPKSRKRTTIFPPHYGLYITREQLYFIKNEARRSGVREFIELIEGLKS